MNYNHKQTNNKQLETSWKTALKFIGSVFLAILWIQFAINFLFRQCSFRVQKFSGLSLVTYSPSSERSTKGKRSNRQLCNSLRYQIYIINSVDKNQNYLVILLHWRSTTVSLETYSLCNFFGSRFLYFVGNFTGYWYKRKSSSLQLWAPV